MICRRAAHFVLLLSAIVVPGSRAQMLGKSGVECEKWIGLVDPELKGRARKPATDKEVMQAIQCLLTCRGNMKIAGFGGATRSEVSQSFPPATVELAALFYISYLFEGRWDHADGVALCDENSINPEGAISAAYGGYLKWFAQIRKLGIAEARRRHLSPLSGTGFQWYGSCGQADPPARQ
jgi:hypothetical protein